MNMEVVAPQAPETRGGIRTPDANMQEKQAETRGGITTPDRKGGGGPMIVCKFVELWAATAQVNVSLHLLSEGDGKASSPPVDRKCMECCTPSASAPNAVQKTVNRLALLVMTGPHTSKREGMHAHSRYAPLMSLHPIM